MREAMLRFLARCGGNNKNKNKCHPYKINIQTAEKGIEFWEYLI